MRERCNTCRVELVFKGYETSNDYLTYEVRCFKIWFCPNCKDKYIERPIDGKIIKGIGKV